MSSRFMLIAPLSLALSNVFAGTMGPINDTTGFGGFYAGLGTGFTTVISHDDYTITRPGFGTIRQGTHKVTNSAVLFSGQVGYGLMFNQNTYLGGKASIYYTPMENSYQISYSSARGPNQLATGQDSFLRSFKPIYNIDGVLGYEMFSHFMPFVEAGVSFANVKHQFVFEGAVTNLTTGVANNYVGLANLDSYKTGYNVGIGANYLATPNWILSGELVYHDFGKNNFNITNVISPTNLATHFRQESNQAVSLLATVSYLIPS
ncbi:outer membrane protein [Legionella bononiensis]|uniref:Outer membrane beta-barrel protein n=1 Tax=Legionella bononiensis TaxID=2793102 RepID=A0ABS1WC14_9GAMM|nr:outer membrane beta-barrel protein [Legionella bononiensis]MBL7481186.1 outer membrane beta-barrel protein [Legionella bononiensis]MBL7526895.1 outer membrane beta-barrel protein [Legionella bononiensis]MBL7563809.1 outer membrane beta-barrel protein [Legionella bononiensis]